jgi:protein tyrosine/serine phosphatase
MKQLIKKHFNKTKLETKAKYTPTKMFGFGSTNNIAFDKFARAFATSDELYGSCRNWLAHWYLTSCSSVI